MKKFLSILLSAMCILTFCTCALADTSEVIVCIDNESSNSNACFKELTGIWFGSANSTLGIHYVNPETNKSLARCSSGSGSAEIRATLPEVGKYDVYYFVSGHSADANDLLVAPVVENGAAGVTVDLTNSSNKGFYKIGNYSFTTTNAVVKVSSSKQIRFSAAKFVYTGADDESQIASSAYTVSLANGTVKAIPEGTTKDAFLSNVTIKQGTTYRFEDKDGLEKTDEIIKTSDKLIITENGTDTEYILGVSKDYLSGLYYEEDFNSYNSYEDFKTETSLSNSSELQNTYPTNSTYDIKLADNNGDKAYSIGALNEEAASQVAEKTLIGIKPTSGNFAVEFDYMQTATHKGWTNFYVQFKDYPAPTQIIGYDPSRGLLSRKPDVSAAPSARWILNSDKSKFQFENNTPYRIKLYFDITNTKTMKVFINDNEYNLYDSEYSTANMITAPTTGAWTSATQIGMSRQFDSTAQKPEQPGTTLYDNIKVYEPITYFEALCANLPQSYNNEHTDIVIKARSIVSDALNMGYLESDFASLPMLEGWEDYLEIGVNKYFSSSVYTVNHSGCSVSNLFSGIKVSELLSNIVPIEGVTLSVLNKTAEDTIVSGDKLIVTLENNDTTEYTIIAKDIRESLSLGGLGAYYEDYDRFTDYEDYKAKLNSEAQSGKTNTYMPTDKYDVSFSKEDGNKFLKIGNVAQKNETQVSSIAKHYNATAENECVMDFYVYRSQDNNTWFQAYGVFSNYRDVNTASDAKVVFSFNGIGQMLARDKNNLALWLYSGDSKLVLSPDVWHNVKLIFDLSDNSTQKVLIDNKEYTYKDNSGNVYDNVDIGNIGTLCGYGFARQLEANSLHTGYVGIDDMRIFNMDSPLKASIDSLCADPKDLVHEDEAEKVLKAQSMAEEAILLGVDTSAVENFEKIDLYNQILNSKDKNITVTSDEYTILDNNISGVVYGAKVSDVLSKINIPVYCTAEIIGKTADAEISENDTLKITKIIDNQQSICYDLVLDSFIGVKGDLVIDKDSKTISNIPYDYKVTDLIDLISYSSNTQLSVYDNDTVNSSIVKNGNILKVYQNSQLMESWVLNVNEPSGDNEIVSVGAYTLTDTEISDIPYKTSFTEFKNNITLPYGASVIYPYDDNYSGNVINMSFKVIAQNGNVKVYSVVVNQGRTDAQISSDIYSIDSDKFIISNVNSGDSVLDILNNITVNNGGTVKLYNKDMTEITSGELTGGETLRVYPEDSKPGYEYTAYLIDFNSVKRETSNTIVSVIDENCVLTGTWYDSSAAVEPGYNGIASKYVAGNGSAKFTPVLPSDGKYSVYVYTSYHSSNPYATAQVYMGDSKLGEKSINFADVSGWKYIGDFDMTAGSNAYVLMQNSGTARISAVKFTKNADILVNSAILTVDNQDYSLSDNAFVENVPSENFNMVITFSDSINADTLNENTVRIITANGNEIDYTGVYDDNNHTYTITSNYPLVKGMNYFVQLLGEISAANGALISKPYSYRISIVKKDFMATSTILYFDSENKISLSPLGTMSAQVTYDVANYTNSDKNIKIITVYYSDDKVEDVVVNDKTVASNDSIKDTVNLTFANPANAYDEIKVFIWDEQYAPLCDTYNLMNK